MAGGVTPNGRFASIVTADPFTVTTINAFLTRAVAAFATYDVQADDTNIAITNAADNLFVSNITFPNVNSILVSSNQRYLVAGNGVNVGVWNIQTIATPAVFLAATTVGTLFASSFTA